MVNTNAQTAKADILKGMAAIEKFSGYSGGVLIRWKKRYPLMPMNKPEDSTLWMADPDKLNQFLKDVATRDTEKCLGPADPGNDGEEKLEREQQGRVSGKGRA